MDNLGWKTIDELIACESKTMVVSHCINWIEILCELLEVYFVCSAKYWVKKMGKENG